MSISTWFKEREEKRAEAKRLRFNAYMADVLDATIYNIELRGLSSQTWYGEMPDGTLTVMGAVSEATGGIMGSLTRFMGPFFRTMWQEVPYMPHTGSNSESVDRWAKSAGQEDTIDLLQFISALYRKDDPKIRYAKEK